MPSIRSFDPTSHLCWGDVATDDLSTPSALKIHLKRSKCDQLSKGMDIFIGSSGNDICPVAAMLAYIASRGNGEGPFYRLGNGHPLTKPHFVAATAAAKAGIEDSVIRSLGRWNSSAFI